MGNLRDIIFSVEHYLLLAKFTFHSLCSHLEAQGQTLIFEPQIW